MRPMLAALVFGVGVPALMCGSSPDGGGTGPGSLELEVRGPAGDVVPVIVTLHDEQKGEFLAPDDDPLMELGQPMMKVPGVSRRPQWDGAPTFDTTGSWSKSLPAGSYTVTVGKGLEFVPVEAEVTIRAGQSTELELEVERHIDMPKKGWWSGDPHVHLARPDSSANDPIFTSASAEDIHVVNTLAMGDERRVQYNQYAFGKKGRAHDHDHAIVPGQEEPRTHILGHTMHLNTPRLIRDQEHYLLYDRVFREAQEAGAVSGYAHVADPSKNRGKANAPSEWDGIKGLHSRFNSALGLTIDLPDDLIDFVEVWNANPRPTTERYHEFLDLGFRLPMTAGSDIPFVKGHIGDMRTYVYTGRGKPFSPDAWFEGLQDGRTFVTNGPLVEFTIGDAMPGDEVKVRRGETVTVEVVATGHADVGAPERISLVQFGQTIDSKSSSSPSKGVLEASFDVTVRDSSWLTVTVEAHNGAIAQTSPIYLVMDGHSTVNRARIDGLINRRLKYIELMRSTVKAPPGKGGDHTASQKKQLQLWRADKGAFLERLDNAEAFYKALRRDVKREDR